MFINYISFKVITKWLYYPVLSDIYLLLHSHIDIFKIYLSNCPISSKEFSCNGKIKINTVRYNALHKQDTICHRLITTILFLAYSSLSKLLYNINIIRMLLPQGLCICCPLILECSFFLYPWLIHCLIFCTFLIKYQHISKAFKTGSTLHCLFFFLHRTLNQLTYCIFYFLLVYCLSPS